MIKKKKNKIMFNKKKENTNKSSKQVQHQASHYLSVPYFFEIGTIFFKMINVIGTIILLVTINFFLIFNLMINDFIEMM